MASSGKRTFDIGFIRCRGGSKLFYFLYVKPQRNTSSPRNIVYSGACNSGVGQSTLDAAMLYMGYPRLNLYHPSKVYIDLEIKNENMYLLAVKCLSTAELSEKNVKLRYFLLFSM